MSASWMSHEARMISEGKGQEWTRRMAKCLGLPENTGPLEVKYEIRQRMRQGRPIPTADDVENADAPFGSYRFPSD